jgi:uncharacterized transporter YbjL
MTPMLLVLVVGGYLGAMTIVVWLIGVLTGGDTAPPLPAIRVAGRIRGHTSSQPAEGPHRPTLTP